MQLTKSLQLLALISMSIFSFSSLADTHTIVSIKKTTTINGTDAEGFKKIFGDTSISTSELSIQCGKNSCEITTARSGFSGDLAKQLLKGRKEAVFVSENEKFKLQCGISNIPFCNVIQQDGILR